jgi:hypothetical protein
MYYNITRVDDLRMLITTWNAQRVGQANFDFVA